MVLLQSRTASPGADFLHVFAGAVPANSPSRPPALGIGPSGQAQLDGTEFPPEPIDVEVRWHCTHTPALCSRACCRATR